MSTSSLESWDSKVGRKTNNWDIANTHRDSKASNKDNRNFYAISLVPSHRASKSINQPKDVYLSSFFIPD